MPKTVHEDKDSTDANALKGQPNTHSLAGWFGENYLPYKRPEGLGNWGAVVSPLLANAKGDGGTK